MQVDVLITDKEESRPDLSKRLIVTNRLREENSIVIIHVDLMHLM
jgi:hypothetical protein